MRLGIAIITSDHDAPGDVIARTAKGAEQAGLDSVWFFDSLGRGNRSIAPLIGAAVAGAVTERIEIGISILMVSMRHPVELANSVLTTQMACEGRLVLGVGSGADKNDFAAVGRPFDQRLKMLDEGIVTMRKLWDGEKVNGIGLIPSESLRGGPPLLIGSWAGSKWITRAAREFEGWIGSARHSNTTVLAEGLKRFRDAGGKRAVTTNIFLDLEATPDPAVDEATFNVMCSPIEASKRLKRLADLGFDDAVVAYRGRGEPDYAAIRALVS